MDERQLFDRFRQSESHQEVRDREEPRGLAGGPRSGLAAAAARARSVVATVITKVGLLTRATAVDLAAERGGAAALDLGEGTRLGPGHGVPTPIVRGHPNEQICENGQGRLRGQELGDGLAGTGLIDRS